MMRSTSKFPMESLGRARMTAEGYHDPDPSASRWQPASRCRADSRLAVCLTWGRRNKARPAPHGSIQLVAVVTQKC